MRFIFISTPKDDQKNKTVIGNNTFLTLKYTIGLVLKSLTHLYFFFKQKVFYPAFLCPLEKKSIIVIGSVTYRFKKEGHADNKER
jgi:hypothetical protein